MKTIEVSESALESLKAMAQRLQEQRDMLLAAAEHANDWFLAAGYSVPASAQLWLAIAACQESTKVME